MRTLYLAVALSSVGMASTVAAQTPSNPRSLTSIEMRGTVRPSPGYNLGNDPNFRSWKEKANGRTSYEYGMLLRFAECVASFDRAAAPRMLRAPLRSLRSANDLERMSVMNRGCTVEHARVHPMLLRAALAETLLKGEMAGGDIAAGAQSPVGLPAVLDGYRLRDVADCQVRQSPELVRNLLATRPGEPTERAAADALFSRSASCGTSTLGRLTPTAARLAIVEAEYMRRFVPGT